MTSAPKIKNQLKSYINRYIPFSAEETDSFFKYLAIKSYSKKEILLETNQVCKQHFFIIEGLLRAHYTNEKGTDKIIQFAIENWWMTNLESYVRETPSNFTIDTLEKSTILSISKDNLEKAFIEIPKLERLFRIIAENTLVAIQRKNEFYMKLSSKERFLTLQRDIPDFLQRVPMYMIASYLDITPEYLSEIRKNL
ncbi:MAG: Crp/Fnr family transcriptional regulator [Flavobacteriaceae bacterium]|nr:Crp/Fnr family transcriptional regulator [Flavobacteriaceae bacterium]